jgi:hypothetical protein
MSRTAVLLSVLAFPIAAALPSEGAALSPQATAAQVCRAKLSAKGKAYAKTRRNLLLSCTTKLLNCALMEELDHANAKSCRDTATASCIAKLNTPGQGLLKAQQKFVEQVTAACTAMGITNVCSTGSGGLHLANLPFCGSDPSGCGGSDLQSLMSCLRNLIDSFVDQEVGTVAPRAGILLDNIGLGAQFGALPRPASQTVSLSQDGSGHLNSVGTIAISASDRLAIDASALPCGSNSNNGKVEIRVGQTGTSCNDLVAEQTVTLQESYLTPGYVGPFDVDMKYCITWKDPGGGGCTSGSGSSVFGTIDVTPDGTPPATPATRATVVGCHKKFQGQGKTVAAFVANKLHACGDKVAKCELANEIDGSGTCTPSYTTPCSTIVSVVDNKLTNSTGKIVAPTSKCTLVPFVQLKSFVGGLGFKLGSCGSSIDLTSLSSCALGQAGMDLGVDCFEQNTSGRRDPRLKQSLMAAGINPADFSCVP